MKLCSSDNHYIASHKLAFSSQSSSLFILGVQKKVLRLLECFFRKLNFYFSMDCIVIHIKFLGISILFPKLWPRETFFSQKKTFYLDLIN